MNKFLTLILILFLSGCAMAASQSPAAWYPKNETLGKDLQECRYEGMRAAPYNPLIAGEVTDMCMRSRGYGRR